MLCAGQGSCEQDELTHLPASLLFCQGPFHSCFQHWKSRGNVFECIIKCFVINLSVVATQQEYFFKPLSFLGHGGTHLQIVGVVFFFFF